MLAPTDDVIDPQGRLGKGTNSVGDQSDHDIGKKRETEPAQRGERKADADQRGIDAGPPGEARAHAEEHAVRFVEAKGLLHEGELS